MVRFTRESILHRPDQPTAESLENQKREQIEYTHRMAQILADPRETIHVGQQDWSPLTY